jgi:hypothetical protein
VAATISRITDLCAYLAVALPEADDFAYSASSASPSVATSHGAGWAKGEAVDPVGQSVVAWDQRRIRAAVREPRQSSPTPRRRSTARRSSLGSGWLAPC